MGTDVQNTVEKVFYRVAKGLSESKAGIYRFEIESMIDSALNRLGDKTADSADYAVLQKTFNVNLSSGVGQLATDCVVRTVAPPRGSVLVAGQSFRCQWLGAIEDLEIGGRPTDFLYYTVRGSTNGAIYIYDGNGTPSTAATCSVIANYYPLQSAGTFSTLPVQLQDDLIAILVGMCQEKMGALDQVPPGTPIGGMPNA